MSGSSEPPKTVEFKIDGQTVAGKPGQTVLQAGLESGHFIPHYCWHPALSISGNCRMCLVNMKGAPKPVIACQTTITPGMEIDASSDSAKAVREGVMELLLINHPLDCPVCDQAGECDLQEYAYKHGRGESRFVEAKNQKPNKDLGDLVRFNGNRCILCSRCVRFTEEITDTHELTIRERGDHNYIDTFPGHPLDNPLSLCTTDLCPVGALLDRDFIHKARVWNLTPTKTICAGCSTGCNITAQTWDGELQRLVPRENQHVNKFWMCDEGRLLYHSADEAQRVLDYTRMSAHDKDNAGETIIREALTASAAVADLAAAWEKARSAKKGIGIVLTGWATNEEALLALSLLQGKAEPKLSAEGLDIALVFAPEGEAWESKDGFKISKDRNPNRAGLAKVLGDLGASHGFQALTKKAQAGDLDLLLILDGMPAGRFELPADFKDALKKVKTLAVFTSSKDSELGQTATLRLPAASWLEKDGTVLNDAERLQRLRPAALPPAGLRWEQELLQDLGTALAIFERNLSSASLFKRLARAEGSAFADHNYGAIGEYGLPLKGTDSGPASTGYEAGPVSRGRYTDSSVAEMIRVSVHRGG